VIDWHECGRGIGSRGVIALADPGHARLLGKVFLLPSTGCAAAVCVRGFPDTGGVITLAVRRYLRYRLPIGNARDDGDAGRICGQSTEALNTATYKERMILQLTWQAYQQTEIAEITLHERDQTAERRRWAHAWHNPPS
jgi:hypothetical protein